MSKSTNMLRTRRKDNNVKPNRRLDRKSSRGMLYENEDLRLKTININAEVERGQSDIKKLKRENDQLRREIWYLRDEYDKLDKLLREKECEDSSSSSSSSTSESESCSSCTEESEAVETSQNIENFQKTNIKKLTQEFDHLSVVPEENSAENSEKNSNSNHASLSDNWNTVEKDIIKPDQSYPVHTISKASTLPVQEKIPKHFFSPIKMNKSNEDYVNNQFLGPEGPYTRQPQPQPNQYHDACPQNGTNFMPHANFYPGLPLPPLNKTTTDVIVKTDNQNFNTLKSQSSFSNGGNLEELLNDIETISHDILKITNSNPNLHVQPGQNYCIPFANFDHFNENTSDIVAQIQNTNLTYLPTGRVDNYELMDGSQSDDIIPPDRPYRSELNVVLMPSPMQLIGVEKYKNIQKSCESLNTRSIENLSASCQNLKIVPETAGPNVIISPDDFYGSTSHASHSQPIQPFVPVPPNCPSPITKMPSERLQQQNLINEQTNPFFFGVMRQPHDNSEYYNNHSPEIHTIKDEPNKWKVETPKKHKTADQKDNEIYSSKTNLLDTAVSSDHVSSENEENLKFKTSRDNKTTDKFYEKSKEIKKPEEVKSPKLGLRHKVSIHFKGKKDKASKSKDTKALETPKAEDKPKSPVSEKKHHSFFDIKFSSDSKDKKGLHQKTASIESKISNLALDSKTTSGESKTSTSENKNSKTDSKNFETSSTSDQKNSTPDHKTKSVYDAKMPDPKALDRKSRKSSSASPERKHGHKEGKKHHRKHKKPERLKNPRSSISADRLHRERSYSVCTDRSNILDHKLGIFGMYDDFTTSDRERTNSLSSCDTLKGRKLSNISHFPQTGKIPWCGCWGNGCL